ncbi:hypothetical protein LTS10_009270 [Elasticomyces elasticus]|nr:hypothetical protein LTS10_009270 [Elasticomyces elasticus]
MATRRSKRANGEKLSDNFAEVEFQTRRQLYLERRVAREEKHAHVTCRFTIFNLLPELRAQIYAFAIETDRPRSLGHLASWCRLSQDPPHAHGQFQVPTLAMVSKQVRAETLPIFFSECLFQIHCNSNYRDIKALDILAEQDALPTGIFVNEPDEYMKTAHDFSGLIIDLYLVKPLLLGIRKRDHVGTFRNIELLVGGPRLMATETEVERTETSSIVINVPTASKLRPRIRFVDPRGGSRRPAELDHVRTKAAATAMQIAETREKFLGYTIHDLEAIVLELRYWPNV